MRRRGAWRWLLWPQPAKRHGWRRSAVAFVRVRAGRVRFAWALPLFVVEDLLEGAALYAACVGPLGRWLTAGILPAWRELRWAGPARLIDIRLAEFTLVLRLI